MRLPKTSYFLLDKALIPFLLCALLTIDKQWIYPRPDMVDPWIYFSYFLDPFIQKLRFPLDYHGERLPIIIPSLPLFLIFKSNIAFLILHVVQYLVCVFCCKQAVQSIVGWRVAVLTSSMLGVYFMFLSAIGQGHADGFGITYSFLSLYLIFQNRKKNVFWQFFLAGISVCLFVFSNLAYSLIALFLFALILIKNQSQNVDVKKRVFMFLIGTLLCFSCLGTINFLSFNEFIFFRKSFEMATTRWNYYCTDTSFNWLNHASWLLLPCTVFLFALKSLKNYKKTNNKSLPILNKLLKWFLFIFATLFCFEIFKFVSFLQFSFYASLIIPPLFLAIAVLIKKTVNKISTKAFVLSNLIVALFGFMSLFYLTNQQNFYFWQILILLLVVFAVTILSNWPNPRNLSLLVLCGFFGILNLCTATSYSSFLNKWPLERKHVYAVDFIGKWQDEEKNLKREDIVKLVAEVYQKLNTYDQAKPLRFWYNVEDRYGSIFTAIASTFLWDQRFVTPHFPSLFAFNRWWPVKTGERIVILSDLNRDVLNQIREPLKLQRLTYCLVNSQEFKNNKNALFKVTILDVYDIHEKGF